MQAKTCVGVLVTTSWCLIPAAFLAVVEAGALILATIVVGGLLYGTFRLMADAPRSARCMTHDDEQAAFIMGIVFLAFVFCTLTWIFAGLMAEIGILSCIAFTLAAGHLIRIGSVTLFRAVTDREPREAHTWEYMLAVVASVVTVGCGIAAFDWSSFDSFRSTARTLPFRQVDVSLLAPVAQATQDWALDSVRTLWTDLLPKTLGIGFFAACIQMALEFVSER